MTDARSVERELAAYYDQEDDRAERPLDPPRIEARERFVASLEPPGSRLLEIGVGAGRDAIAFVAAGVDFFGVDLSHEHARRTSNVGATVVQASVRGLPFASGSFGAVWSMSTLMHVPNTAIEDALTEVRRVLAPGGAAAVGVWGGPDVEHHSDQDRYDPPRFFSRRSNDRWQTLLALIGPIERFETWGTPNDEFYYQYAIVRRA